MDGTAPRVTKNIRTEKLKTECCKQFYREFSLVREQSTVDCVDVCVHHKGRRELNYVILFSSFPSYDLLETKLIYRRLPPVWTALVTQTRRSLQ